MKFVKFTIIGLLSLGTFAAFSASNTDAHAAVIPRHYRGNWHDKYGDHMAIRKAHAYSWGAYSTHKVRMSIRHWSYNGSFWRYALVLKNRPMATTVLGYYHGHIYIRQGTAKVKFYR